VRKLDVKQLITFRTAAENLNFTKTAKLLKYAQSSVTVQIQSLEKELDTQLFERLGKKIYLTESGRKFKVYADKMISLADEAKLVISGFTEPTGVLKIGAQESQCTYRLPPILKEFKNQLPNVKLIFKPAHSNEMVKEQLQSGNLDVAFIMDVVKPEDSLIKEPLVKDELKLVASPDHPLVNKELIFAKDLEYETLLLTEQGCSYRKIFEDYLRESNVYPSNKIEFVSIEAIKQCVIAGLGIAILPGMVVEQDIKDGTIKELKWEQSNFPLITQIAWHKDKQMTVPLISFIELTRRILKMTI